MLIESAFQKIDSCPVLEGRGGEIPPRYSINSIQYSIISSLFLSSESVRPGGECLGFLDR